MSALIFCPEFYIERGGGRRRRCAISRRYFERMRIRRDRAFRSLTKFFARSRIVWMKTQKGIYKRVELMVVLFVFFFFLQLYEINDDPKRKEFLDDLFSFMQKRGEFLEKKKILKIR